MDYRRLFGCILFSAITCGICSAQKLTPSFSEGKWGFQSKDGSVVIPCIYDEVNNFVDGIAIVSKDSLWGFVDSKGVEKNIRYDRLSTFGNHGLYKGLVKGKWQILSHQGNPQTSTQQYDVIFPIHKGVSIVVNDQKRGLIDEDGKCILPAKYESLECKEYIVYCKNFKEENSTIGMCDYKGNIILPEGILQSAYSPSDGIILGKVWNAKDRGTSFAFYNIKTKQVKQLPSPFSIQYHEFANGYCLVSLPPSVHYFIDKTGNKVTPDYEAVGDCHEGYYVIKQNGKFGVIDSLLHQVIPCEYEDGGMQVCEGLWNTMKDDEWGYLDMKGQKAIPFEYEFTHPFFKGHAYIGEFIDGKVRFGLIDRTGKEILPIQWSNINYTLNDLGAMKAVWVAADSLYCRLDLSSMAYSYKQPGFNVVEFDRHGNSIVRQGEFWGCIDFEGQIKIPTRIPTKDMVLSILEKMEKEGKQKLNLAETYRNGIYANEKRNKCLLSNQIPEDLWDY